MSPTRGARAHLDGLGRRTRGSSAASSALWTLPARGADVEPRGGALADADLEVADRGLEHDRAAHDLAQPDVAVGGLGADAGVRQVDGDAAVGRLEPQRRRATSPTQVSPLEFLITAPPSSSRTRTSPDPAVTSACAGRPVHGDVAGAALQAQRGGLVDADAAEAGLDPAARRAGRRSGSPPAARRRARSSRPAARSSRRPSRRCCPGSQERSFGALTSRCPSAYSTRVCSAALTSSPLDGSLGRTSTTVRRGRRR